MSPRHLLLGILVAVIWGFNFLAIRFGIDDMPPLLFVAIRFLFVAIPAVFLLKPPAIGWRNIVLIGSFMSLGQFALLYVSMELGMPAGLASLLLQTQVVLTVVVAAVLLRERPTRVQLVGILVGMAGLTTVVAAHAQSAPWLPVVVILLAALSWAIGNVLSRRAKAASGLSLVVWSGAVVPIPAFALSLLIETPPVVFDALTHITLDAVLSTAYTVVFASFVGYGIWNTLLARYPAGSVAPLTLLVPPIGILSAWLVLGEVPTVLELVGGAVMLTGLAIAVIRRRSASVVAAPVHLRDEVLE
ncbi:MAG TPA: EamA family transporter [Rhodoglobus sp.]|nr:EamA family transporter [Rhodoglobus sp.]